MKGAIRQSYRNLPIDRKLLIAFAVPLCMMLIISLIITDIILKQYDSRILVAEHILAISGFLPELHGKDHE